MRIQTSLSVYPHLSRPLDHAFPRIMLWRWSPAEALWNLPPSAYLHLFPGSLVISLCCFVWSFIRLSNAILFLGVLRDMDVCGWNGRVIYSVKVSFRNDFWGSMHTDEPLSCSFFFFFFNIFASVSSYPSISGLALDQSFSFHHVEFCVGLCISNKGLDVLQRSVQGYH